METTNISFCAEHWLNKTNKQSNWRSCSRQSTSPSNCRLIWGANEKINTGHLTELMLLMEMRQQGHGWVFVPDAGVLIRCLTCSYATRRLLIPAAPWSGWGSAGRFNGACLSRWRILAMHAALAQLYALRLQQNVHWLQIGHQCELNRWRDFHFLMILQIFVTSRQKKKCVWAAVLKAPVVYFFMVAAHRRLSWHVSFLPLPLLLGFLVHFVLIRAPQSLRPHTYKNTQQKDIGQFTSSLFDWHPLFTGALHALVLLNGHRG